MSHPPIFPVLLAGGSGTRLWPASRRAFPKQFSSFDGGETLFQQALRRVQGTEFAAPLVITGEDFRFLVGEQATAIAAPLHAILIEPEGRDTAPAILAAALSLQKTNPDALMLVAAADHVIPNVAAFQATVMRGAEAAREGAIVTFGIRPTRPETGYGWLELPSGSQDGTGPIDLVRFVEKPALPAAEAMLSAGNYLWNSGLFLFSVQAIVQAFAAHMPALQKPVAAAVAQGQADLDFLRLAAEPWAKADKISIDFAVMEKAENLKVVPYGEGWSDLGDWQAVWREAAAQGEAQGGAHISGDAQAFDCQDTYLHVDAERTKLIGLGLSGIIAVATEDAVLIADKARTQDVKIAVEALRAQGDSRADSFPADQRPWGNFRSLAKGDRFQVKRIEVKPGGKLSLQSHYHRAEHWVVVAGSALVTVDETVRTLNENESVYIPLGAIHRLENQGKVPLVLIEVQTGSYLGEDDIVRYEDVYSRS